MVRPFPFPFHDVQNIFFSLPLALMGTLVSVSVVIAICARHSKRYHLRKYSRKNPTSTSTTTSGSKNIATPSSFMLLPEKMITITGSDEAADHYKYCFGEESSEDHCQMLISDETNIINEGFGEGGLWQKSILMGERCEPPQFPGVLFYDSGGNRISELPRSPRAFSLQKYSSLTHVPPDDRQ